MLPLAARGGLDALGLKGLLLGKRLRKRVISKLLGFSSCLLLPTCPRLAKMSLGDSQLCPTAQESSPFTGVATGAPSTATPSPASPAPRGLRTPGFPRSLPALPIKRFQQGCLEASAAPGTAGRLPLRSGFKGSSRALIAELLELRGGRRDRARGRHSPGRHCP